MTASLSIEMHTQDLTDEKQVAFMELYEPIHERFVRFCQARMHNSEEVPDLVNETLLRAYENFEKLRSKDAFLYFLFGIATRVINSQYRKKKYWGTYEARNSEQIPDGGWDPSQHAELHLLYKALDQLPPLQREALILFEISGFPIKDIQQIQNSKESAVKARLMRGRKKLAHILSEQNISSHERK